MAKKILLFLSPLRENTPDFIYNDVQGNSFMGLQTNEAPTLALLHQHPDVTHIIAIVTPSARESDAWATFQKTIIDTHELPLLFQEVPMDEDEDFHGRPLAQLLELLEDKDELLLETTGGFRNAVMYTTFIVRVLAARNIPTICAVYANLEKKLIQDITPMFQIFDLLGGLQELISLGNVRTLRNYYKTQPKDEAMEQLLQAMEELSETLTLCRTRLIGEKVTALEVALIQAQQSEEPLLRHLIPVFRQKFGKSLTTPGIIKWCIESDMVQQALTVFTERIPSFYFEKNMITQTAPQDTVTAADYRDPDTVRFMDEFLSSSSDSIVTLRNYINQHYAAIAKATGSLPKDIQIGVHNIQLIADLAFPYGSYRGDWVRYLPEDKTALANIKEHFKPEILPKSKESFVRQFATMSKEKLSLVLELGTVHTEDSRVFSIENMRQNWNGYEVHLSIPAMQTICRDYLYIKAVRNMINHANEQSSSSQKQLMAYLKNHQYPDLDTLSSSQIKTVLREALEHLKG